MNTSEGETVVFDCKTLGNPTPVVTFYKNGVGESYLWVKLFDAECLGVGTIFD